MQKKIPAFLIAALSLLQMGCSGKSSADPQFSLDEKAARETASMIAIRLQIVSYAADQFATDFGCAPQSIDDLRSRPSDERLRELGCARTGPKDAEYIAPSQYQEIKNTIRIVKRWDGIYALAWEQKTIRGDEVTKYCSVLDARNMACRSSSN